MIRKIKKVLKAINMKNIKAIFRYIKNNGSEIANTTKSKVNNILQSKK